MDETFGCGGVGSGEYHRAGRAGRAFRAGEPEVHIMGRVQAESRMAVLGVVPRKEVGAEHPRVLNRPKAVGEIRPVLERSLYQQFGQPLGGIKEDQWSGLADA